jgi:hypothetical protein
MSSPLNKYQPPWLDIKYLEQHTALTGTYRASGEFVLSRYALRLGSFSYKPEELSHNRDFGFSIEGLRARELPSARDWPSRTAT